MAPKLLYFKSPKTKLPSGGLDPKEQAHAIERLQSRGWTEISEQEAQKLLEGRGLIKSMPRSAPADGDAEATSAPQKAAAKSEKAPSAEKPAAKNAPKDAVPTELAKLSDKDLSKALKDAGLSMNGNRQAREERLLNFQAEAKIGEGSAPADGDAEEEGADEAKE